MGIARMGGTQGNFGAGEKTWDWKAMAELLGLWASFGAGRPSRDSRAGKVVMGR